MRKEVLVLVNKCKVLLTLLIVNLLAKFQLVFDTSSFNLEQDRTQ